MDIYNKQVQVAVSLIAALAAVPVAAQAAMHYQPLVKEARADNQYATREIITAATRGSRVAQFYAGVLRHQGWGVKKNYAKAATWFRKAATQGDLAAENNLGVAYRTGHGVPQNYAKAATWFRKAAAHGDPLAETNLGSLYFRGLGVNRDYTKGVAWWRKAAMRGFAPAEKNLAFAYLHGLGVQKSLSKSIAWLGKAFGASPAASSSVTQFRTYCNNASCVRRYSNGATVHFTACINPADGQPMLNAPVHNGTGSCSGTDSEGNVYGVK